MSLLDHLPEIIDGATNIIAGASVLASITPNKKDDGILSWISGVINFLAFNFGFAKNKNSTN